MPAWIVATLRTLATRPVVESLADDREEELARLLGNGGGPAWPRVWLATHLTVDVSTILAARTGTGVTRSRRIVRDAWRSLRSSPSTSLFALVILALGMAGATVTFSVVDAVVLRPYSFGSASDLVVAKGVSSSQAGSNDIVAAMEYETWRDHVAAFSELAAYESSLEVVNGRTPPLALQSARVTANLFDVLRVRPALGRPLVPEDEVPGRAHVIVLSHSVWQRVFAGDASIIGRSIPLKSGPAIVIGVMPPAFTFPVVPGDQAVDAWTPYAVPVDEQFKTAHGVVRYWQTVGRLRPGVSRAQAESQMSGAMMDLRARFPGAYKDWRPVVIGLDEAWLGRVRDWMLLLLLAVVVVMAIACTNVANLLLIRCVRRAREIGIRAALGATRRQIGLSLLIESVMMAFGAGAIALAASVAGVRAVRAALPDGIVRASTIAVDLRVLAVAAAASIATGLAFGIVPAWHASRTDVVTLLKDGGQAATGRRNGWRAGLLVAEIAIVSLLLVTTTLFVSSFVHVASLDLGFDRRNLFAVSQVNGFKGDPADIVRAVEAVPGVLSAAVVKDTPPLIMASFGGGWSGTVVERADRRDLPALQADLFATSGAYFKTARIPILRGTVFADDASTGDQLVLDEMGARSLFPDRDPIGGTVTWANKPRTVVGIVQTVRMDGPGVAPRPSVYVPLSPQQWPELVVRTSSSSTAVSDAVSAAVGRFARPGWHIDVRSIDAAFRTITADRRFAALVLGIFGLLATLIGAAGIYAVMSSTVEQQRRDLAIRVALGATAARVRREVLAHATFYVSAGLAIGLPAGWSASRFFSSLLFGVTPSNVTTYGIDAGLLMGVTLLAALLPARRAARVDPIEVLKAS